MGARGPKHGRIYVSLVEPDSDGTLPERAIVPAVSSKPTQYDVLVMGAGLAGLTLALQILRARPEVSLALVDRASWPPPVAAHKVGESTVELGTWYLREVLGLADYLDTEHLPKLGLRFFFQRDAETPLSARPEFGATGELPVPSHQLDRGLLEAELARRVVDAGGHFLSGHRVSSVEFAQTGHSTMLRSEQGERTLTSRWLVDATGRASTLKRSQELLEKSPHDPHAVWFRVDGDIDLDSWDDDPTFRDRVPAGLRRLSTNHLMGDGYWVWFIPLSSGFTSVGIVSSPSRHDLKAMSTLDGAMEWLREFEPLAARAIEPLLDGVQDFHVLRHYSHGAKRVFHPRRWAITGDAGVFLDPFYSPGTDFIALSNSYITDLVTRDLKGERIRSRVNQYNRTYLEMVQAWQPIYLEMYATFGVGQVAVLKVIWDFSTYWSFQVPAFVNCGFVDVQFMTRTRALWQRVTELNRCLQKNLLHWATQEPHPTALTAGFVDPMKLTFLRLFQEQMVDKVPLDALEERLTSHLATLELVASEITRRAAHRLYGLPLDALVDPLTFQLEDYALSGESSPHGAEPQLAIRADLQLAWFGDKESGVLVG